MELPNKRLKQSAPDAGEAQADFVSLSVEDDESATQYGYNHPNGDHETSQPDFQAPRAPRAMYQQQHARNARNDPRNARDKPSSKHVLPGYEPWILVKTKYGRRFVHNETTKESFWRYPPEVVQGVTEFDALEKQQREKDANAAWAEEQLKQMRVEQAQKGASKGEEDGKGRRRRSESLQREDEAALMAELAAEAEKAEENDVKEVVKSVQPLQPKTVEDADGGYGSDSSYEVIEVTDSEFEDEDEAVAPDRATGSGDADVPAEQRDDGPMEFGEDDIAYQLAAMEQDYEGEDMDDEEASQAGDYDDEEVEEGEDETEEQAAATFREMLDDHRISPFTPWEKLLEDESANSVVMDHRYTLLPNMRTRKAVWEAWVKDTAARLKEERAKVETLDPKVPYLAFLAEKASPKLYWPEFKRKYKKEAVMNDRKLSDKDREKLYRDHINRFKLPESTRKGDLIKLLKPIPLKHLNQSTILSSLPQQLTGNLHFISLPASIRNEVISSHISTLPPAPEDEDGEVLSEENAELIKRERQTEALRARARKVEEERLKAEKAERFARRDLREEEREVRRAMEVGRSGLKGQLE